MQRHSYPQCDVTRVLAQQSACNAVQTVKYRQMERRAPTTVADVQVDALAQQQPNNLDHLDRKMNDVNCPIKNIHQVSGLIAKEVSQSLLSIPYSNTN